MIVLGFVGWYAISGARNTSSDVRELCSEWHRQKAVQEFASDGLELAVANCLILRWGVLSGKDATAPRLGQALAGGALPTLAACTARYAELRGDSANSVSSAQSAGQPDGGAGTGDGSRSGQGAPAAPMTDPAARGVPR